MVSSPAVSPVPSASPSPAPEGAIATADPAISVFLWGNAPTTDRDLTLAQQGGFHWIKQRFEWRNIEGHGKGQFEWNEPDRIVQAAEDHGLKIIARIDNQPQWASTRVQFPASSAPDDLQDWADYVSALATRYKGRIQAYEVWNEPNLSNEWGSSPDPAAYTQLLQASYTAIKAADPQASVISAGLSPTTTTSSDAMPDMQFLQGMYAAGAKGSFDMLGSNSQAFKAPPCADPAQVAQDPTLTNNDPSSTDLTRVYAFRHVEDYHQLMVQQGDGDKQIGVMETGFTTDQRPGSPYAWFAVSPDEQGQDLVSEFQCARSTMAPWLGPLSVIYIPDPAWTPQQEEFWWSITNPDGTLRPGYSDLKQYLTQ